MLDISDLLAAIENPELIAIPSAGDQELLSKVRTKLAQIGIARKNVYDAHFTVLERIETQGEGAGNETHVNRAYPYFEQLRAHVFGFEEDGHYHSLITDSLILPTVSNSVQIRSLDNQDAITIRIQLAKCNFTLSDSKIHFFYDHTSETVSAWKDFRLILDSFGIDQYTHELSRIHGCHPLNENFYSLPLNLWNFTKLDNQNFLELIISVGPDLNTDIILKLDGRIRVNCLPFALGVKYAYPLNNTTSSVQLKLVDDARRAKARMPFILSYGDLNNAITYDVDIAVNHDGTEFTVYCRHPDPPEEGQITYLLFSLIEAMNRKSDIVNEEWQYATDIFPTVFKTDASFNTEHELEQYLSTLLRHRLGSRNLDIKVSHTIKAIDDRTEVTALRVQIQESVPEIIKDGIQKNLEYNGPVGLVYIITNN